MDGRVGVMNSGKMTHFDERTHFHHLRKDPNRDRDHNDANARLF